MLVLSPVHDLVEGDFSSSVPVDSAELVSRILNRSDPFLDLLPTTEELIQADLVVLSAVQQSESLIELKVLSEQLQEQLELALLNVVVAILCSCWACLSGSLVCPHNCSLAAEDLWDFQGISHSFIQLCQGQISIAVHIEASPERISFLLGFWGILERDQPVQLVPVHAVFLRSVSEP